MQSKTPSQLEATGFDRYSIAAKVSHSNEMQGGDAWRESISIILMNEMVKIGYLSELGTSRGDGRGTAWSLSAYSIPGQQAEASAAQHTLRAVP